jgi:hypothetical protein
MGVLILAIECLVKGNWLDFTDPASLSWRYSAEAARSRVCDRDVLVIGDSLVKHAVLPSVLDKAAALRAENLGAARCPTLMSYFLLRRSLESGARPRAIIFNAKPAVLMGDIDFNRRYWQEVLSTGELWDLFKLKPNAAFVLSVLAGKVCPSLRSRIDIRAHLAARLRGQTGPLSVTNRALWRNWTVNHGANVACRKPPYDGKLTRDEESGLHPRLFHCDKTNAKAVDRLLHLAQEHQIPVLWLLPPLSPDLQSVREQSGAERSYEQFVRGYQARFPQTVTILDGRNIGYPPSAFADATHLDAQGAISLSRSIARVVGRVTALPREMSTTRWISLDPWSAGSVEIAIAPEDVETSRAIAIRNSVIR